MNFKVSNILSWNAIPILIPHIVITCIFHQVDKRPPMTLPVCVMTCVIGRARPRKSRMICIKRCGNTRLINELRVLAHFIKEVEGAVSFLWYRSHRGATPYRGVAWLSWDRAFSLKVSPNPTTCFHSMRQSSQFVCAISL